MLPDTFVKAVECRQPNAFVTKLVHPLLMGNADAFIDREDMLRNPNNNFCRNAKQSRIRTILIKYQFSQ